MPVPGKMCGARAPQKNYNTRPLHLKLKIALSTQADSPLMPKNITPTGFGLTDDYIYNYHTPSELS